MSALEHRAAATVVEEALVAVFDPDLVRRLREDSPLAVVGMIPADAVAVADAVARAAADVGVSCVLTDADVDGVETVADLVAAVQRASDRAQADSR